MGTLLAALKSLKLWQIGVLAAVLIAVAGATYGVYAMAGTSGRTDLSKNQQLIPVLYGNVVNQVSTNGSLVFANRSTLTFGTQGTVAEILVTEGQQVKEGQTLAKLDAATLTSLAKAVAQARVNLRTAQDAPAVMKAPQTTLSLAQAEASVANARSAATKAQDTLDRAKVVQEKDLATAEANAANARLNVEKAQDLLEKARRPFSDDDITKAKVAVDSAKSAVRDAQVALDNAGKNVASTGYDWDARILDAKTPVTNAEQTYISKFSTRFKVIPDVAKSPWENFNFSPDTPLSAQEVEIAWDSLVKARLQQQSTALQATSARATALNNQLKANQALDSAFRAQSDAETKLAEAEKPGDALDVDAKEKALALTKVLLSEAEETLSSLKAGPDPIEVQVKEKALAVSQAFLAQAQVDLANLKARTPLDVALKDAEVAAAQATLDTAVQRLEGATLKAPMAGVVSLVNVEAGQIVNATFTIVEVVDSTTIEMDGVVDQTDVLFVKVGAQANVTMDALRGQVLQGTVSSIASAAQTQQGIVSYPISIQLKVPQGLQLREGLSATASIVIREENNVLLVPLQALYGTFDQPVVKLFNNGRTEERPVVLGNSDDYWVAVRQGLAQGDQVVMVAQQATAGQLNVGQAFRQFQGQFGQGALQGQGGGGSQGGGRNTPRVRPTPRPGR